MRGSSFVAPLVILLALGGCVRPRANTPAQSPLLDVPAPPPRVIVPPEPEEPAEEMTAEEPDTTARRPSTPRPRPPRERSETVKPAEPKPETPPDAEPPRPATVPPVQLGPLQPALPASPGEMERQVRDQLAQAKRDLDRIDYRALGADAKSQYDTAKRFIEQASQALTDKNFLFAAKLAEKAVGLASNLQGR